MKVSIINIYLPSDQSYVKYPLMLIQNTLELPKSVGFVSKR